VLGKKLGEGAFGAVYKVSVANPEKSPVKVFSSNPMSNCQFRVLSVI